MPSRDEVLGLSRGEASTVYREHLNEWQAGRKPVDTAETLSVAAEAPQETVAEVVAQEPQEPQAELKIVSARPEGSGEAGSGDSDEKEQVLDQLKQDLLASQEERESALQEGEELRSRVDDLELQLDDLQRLLTLKNEQFAQMQAAVAAQVDAEREAEAELGAEEETGTEVETGAETETETEDEVASSSEKVAETTDELAPAPMDEEKRKLSNRWLSPNR